MTAATLRAFGETVDEETAAVAAELPVGNSVTVSDGVRGYDPREFVERVRTSTPPTSTRPTQNATRR